MLFDEALEAAGEPSAHSLPRARRRLDAMTSGSVLRLSSDDPETRADVVHLCAEEGHELVGHIARGDGAHYFIRKG